MSNALALASVSAVLRDLLNDGLVNANIDTLGQFAVSSLPLDQVVQADDADPVNRLNIYMWHASRNAAWFNQCLPARNAGGAAIDSPVLALDLHFVLSATGAEELNAEILLGYAMQLLHETPVLTRDDIRTVLGAPGAEVDASLLPAAMQFLAASDLADQFEQIRISPAVLDESAPMQLEGLSNLWSAFSAPLRPSALYHVSCVLIESRRPSRSALPVLTLGGRTGLIRNPHIDRVQALPQGPGTIPDPHAPIQPGDSVAIDGTALASDLIRLRLGERVLTPEPRNIANGRIAVTLPQDIEAGLATLLIEHLFASEGSIDQRVWERSNPKPVVISPILMAQAVLGTTAAGRFDGTVTATLEHPVGADQTAVLLFDPAPGGTELPFSQRCRPRNITSTEVVADLRNKTVGTYLFRVEIDGAQSALTMGPTGFNGPLAVLA